MRGWEDAKRHGLGKLLPLEAVPHLPISAAPHLRSRYYGHPPRPRPHLHRAQHLHRPHVDDRHVVGEAVGRVRRPAVGRERDPPRAAPHRNARRARAASRRRAGRGRGRRPARRRDVARPARPRRPRASPARCRSARARARDAAAHRCARSRHPTSLVAKANRPSGENATARGRASTRNVVTTFSVRMSITEIVLLVSPVTYTHRPSGDTVTPSGSVPTTSEASTFPDAGSMIDALPASSFAATMRRPSGVIVNCSGSVPAGMRRTTCRVARSTSAMASFGPGVCGRSSLSATRMNLWSGEMRTPRARPGTGIDATGCERRAVEQREVVRPLVGDDDEARRVEGQRRSRCLRAHGPGTERAAARRSRGPRESLAFHARLNAQLPRPLVAAPSVHWNG